MQENIIRFFRIFSEEGINAFPAKHARAILQMKGGESMKQQILQYANETYGTEAEYPFEHETAVLRQAISRKWYGVIMKVSPKTLGLRGEKPISILTVKCDPLLIGSLLLSEGFHPAYHMNKKHWVTIRLDGSVPLSDICGLLDMSYDLTKPHIKKRKT